MATNRSTIKIPWDSFHLPGLRSNVTFPMKPSLMLFKCQAINSFALGVLIPPCTLLCYDTYHSVSHYWLAFSLLWETLSLMRDCVLPLQCLRFLAQNRGFMFIGCFAESRNQSSDSRCHGWSYNEIHLFWEVFGGSRIWPFEENSGCLSLNELGQPKDV